MKPASKRTRAPGGGRKPGPLREVFFVSIHEPIAAAFDAACEARGEQRKDRLKLLVEADAEGRISIADK